MAWIRTVPPGAARGLLARIYAAARRRAGKVFQILQVQSLRPKVLDASTRLYIEVMHAPESGLSRAEREMIATAVSAFNGCHY